MTSRKDQIERFLDRSGWGGLPRHVVAGDASNRRYDRIVRKTGETAIFMDAPREKGEDIEPFVLIAKFLESCGLSAPRILASDSTLGFLLLEDLGDGIYARVLEEKPQLENEIYSSAVDVLVHLHGHKPPDIPCYDAAVTTDLAALAFDWYQRGVGIKVEGRGVFCTHMFAILTPLDSTPRVLIQRDYHAENLLWLPERQGVARVGLLDFQDSMLGHPAYDLVSILQDARRDVPLDIETQMIARFVQQTSFDPEEFNQAYARLGIQRNLRILGVFARLSMAYGKPGYVDLIPRVWSHLMRMLKTPGLEDLRTLLTETLPAPTPGVLNTLKEQCGKHALP